MTTRQQIRELTERRDREAMCHRMMEPQMSAFTREQSQVEIDVLTEQIEIMRADYRDRVNARYQRRVQPGLFAEGAA